jgi:hypothetical protein
MTGLAVAAFTVAAAAVASAQTPPPAAADDDHAIVFELGAAADWSPTEGSHPGATVAFEVTPIERWLEVEVGFTTIHDAGGTEMPIDVLFKKPWRFSPRFEFMVGLGPELIHTTGSRDATYWGLSSVLDFMFWPTKNVGWYLEPGYELTRPGGVSHHGAGMSAGLLLGR